MALVNHAKKEINAKIVYYGPAGSGKSAALSYIYSRIKATLRGELKSVPAGADHMLFFDFSPFETPLPNGYRVCLHLYTLTGAVTNPATWKMTLKSADGIIIMVNPSVNEAENIESVSQLRDFLSAYGVGLHETPAVLQLNSLECEAQTDRAADIAATLGLSQLTARHSNTASGEGLLEALTTLSRQVLERVTVLSEPDEADLPHPCPTEEAKSVETPHGDIPTTSAQELVDTPQISLLAQEITSAGKTIRIPLEISHRNNFSRIVVTVNIDLEER